MKTLLYSLETEGRASLKFAEAARGVCMCPAMVPFWSRPEYAASAHSQAFTPTLTPIAPTVTHLFALPLLPTFAFDSCLSRSSHGELGKRDGIHF